MEKFWIWILVIGGVLVILLVAVGKTAEKNKNKELENLPDLDTLSKEDLKKLYNSYKKRSEIGLHEIRKMIFEKLYPSRIDSGQFISGHPYVDKALKNTMIVNDRQIDDIRNHGDSIRTI